MPKNVLEYLCAVVVELRIVGMPSKSQPLNFTARQATYIRCSATLVTVPHKDSSRPLLPDLTHVPSEPFRGTDERASQIPGCPEHMSIPKTLAEMRTISRYCWH